MFGDALADDGDQRRVSSVAGVEIAPLQQRLAHALEILGHGYARVGGVDAAWLRCGRPFGVEEHQCPGRVHWRRRNDRGGFDSGQSPQLRERSLERALLRRGGGKESIGNGDVKGEAAFVSKPHCFSIRFREYCLAVTLAGSSAAAIAS